MTNADCQRRHRARLKGRPRIDDIDGLIDALIRTRYLKEWDERDPIEVAKACREMLIDWAREN